MSSMCNALTLYLYFTSRTLLLCDVHSVQVSTAVQPVHSTPHVHSVSPLTQPYPTICLYRPSNTIITMHTPLHFRRTDLCIYTCALRQTPHGHMGRGVLGSVCNALTLYVYFASETPFLYGVHRVQASTAVQPIRRTHVHISSPPTQHYPTLCLYRPPNTSISMHTPLQSGCTGICIYTCALRQTPYGHMRRGVVGSVCNALTLYVYFASRTPFLYGILRVQASTAVQPVHSTHVCFSSPLTHTTLLSACTGHQIRASQCTPHCTPVVQASVYILVHYGKHHMDTYVEVCWALDIMH